MMMNSPKVFIGGLSDVHNDENTGIMDLRTTSSTSHQRSQPTIGETTISAEEEERIRAEVRAVMREQFAEGRAALRANLRTA